MFRLHLQIIVRIYQSFHPFYMARPSRLLESHRYSWSHRRRIRWSELQMKMLTRSTALTEKQSKSVIIKTLFWQVSFHIVSVSCFCSRERDARTGKVGNVGRTRYHIDYWYRYSCIYVLQCLILNTIRILSIRSLSRYTIWYTLHCPKYYEHLYHSILLCRWIGRLHSYFQHYW